MLSPFRFVIEILRATGEVLAESPIEPDWEPALEWTRLAGLRSLGIWAPEPAAERGIEPLWHPTLGEPYIRGVRVHFGRDEASAWFEDFSVGYFKAQARAISAPLVEQGTLNVGDQFLYRTSAFAMPRPTATDGPSSWETGDASPPLVLLESSLDGFIEASTTRDEGNPADVTVFVHEAVLDDAVTLSQRAGDRETGGFLVGHLHRATPEGEAHVRRELFVEVTELLPARHTLGDSLKVTFTSETWTDVRTTIALRGRGERLLGWFHSHPQAAWCRARGCSPEAQRACPQAVPFLSEEDGTLHRTMFSRAFMLALLVTVTIDRCVPSLFGWRSGVLAARGFRVIGARSTVDAPSTSDAPAIDRADDAPCPAPATA